METTPKKARFRIERLEERIAPSALSSCRGGSGSKHKGHSGSKHKCKGHSGSKFKGHSGSKFKCKGHSHKCPPPPCHVPKNTPCA